jgi:hypothetical protein
MRDQQIEILIDLYKKEDLKKSFLKYQYILPSKVGSLMLSQRKIEMAEMLKVWTKKEEKINKKWRKNPEWSLIKVLSNKRIIPFFPNSYSFDEVTWAVNKRDILYENIMFVKTNDGFKLISVLDKAQLIHLNTNGAYLDAKAAAKLLNNPI